MAVSLKTGRYGGPYPDCGMMLKLGAPETGFPAVILMAPCLKQDYSLALVIRTEPPKGLKYARITRWRS